MSYAWITIPHQGRPSIFGPFDDMAETLEFIQQYESSEKFNTQPMPEILKSVGDEEFLADAGRQYHRAYIENKEAFIDSLKNPRRHGHSWVELKSESRKFAFDHWYDEAREEFIDGFTETCGAKSREDAEMIWDNWSSGIQGGANSEGFGTEIAGEDAGREEGCKYREHSKREVEA